MPSLAPDEKGVIIIMMLMIMMSMLIMNDDDNEESDGNDEENDDDNYENDDIEFACPALPRMRRGSGPWRRHVRRDGSHVMRGLMVMMII